MGVRVGVPARVIIKGTLYVRNVEGQLLGWGSRVGEVRGRRDGNLG